jgi:hypothetical protein
LIEADPISDWNRGPSVSTHAFLLSRVVVCFENEDAILSETERKPDPPEETVGHTPEQREQHALCGARKKSGERCRAFAGQGTPHPGIGRCKFHGGSTRNHITNATIAEARQRMVTFGAPIEVLPQEALLAALHLASGHVAWLREEIGAVQELGTSEAQVLVSLYADERDRLARVAKACLDAGVAERQVKLAERYGSELADLLRAVLSDGELGLSKSQRERLPAVLRRYLGALEGNRSLLPAA